MVDKKKLTWKDLGVPDALVKEREEFAKAGGTFEKPPAGLVERTLQKLEAEDRKRRVAKPSKDGKK